MNPSPLSQKSTTVRLPFPPRLVTGPLRVAPWLQKPVLGRLFFSPVRRSRRRAGENGVPVARVLIAGKQVTVRARGSGPVVLFVHGWEGSAGDLFELAERAVASGFTAVTCDMPAHGETRGSTTSVAEFMNAIEEIARLVGPLHAIVAHSLGGTAATLAMSRRVRAQGVVLIAPMVSFDFALDEFSRLLALDSHLREVVAQEAERRVGLTRADVDLMNQCLPDVPALIIHDEADSRTPHEHSQGLVERWTGAILKTTQGLGHRRILSEEGVVHACVEFLRGLPRRQTDPLDLGVVPELLDGLS